MYIFLELAYELKKHSFNFYYSKKSLVHYWHGFIVKMGNTKVFLFTRGDTSGGGGGVLVTFKDRYFLFDTVIVLKQKKAQKLSQSKEVFFLKSSPYET